MGHISRDIKNGDKKCQGQDKEFLTCEHWKEIHHIDFFIGLDNYRPIYKQFIGGKN